jgi:hypothetical protein
VTFRPPARLPAGPPARLPACRLRWRVRNGATRFAASFQGPVRDYFGSVR